MNILHLFSGNVFTGAVEHALELGAWQQQQGHQVWLASDFKEAPGSLPHTTIPVHDRRYRQRFRNRALLRQLVLDNDIHVVHAHSRAASAIAHGALKRTYAALVSTVHGRQHVHFSSKTFDVYGERIIAISEDLRQHLITDLRKDARKIHVLPNGLTFPESDLHELPDFFHLALIGRLSGPKGVRAAELFEQVFPRLLAHFPGLHIHIVGSAEGAIPNNGDAHLEALKTQFGDQVQIHGFLSDITPVLQSCGLVIGAGRVAIRALGMGKAVLALGEATCEGIVLPETIEQIARSNFGDTGPSEPAVAEKALLALNGFLLSATQQTHFLDSRAALQAFVRDRYALDGIGNAVQRLYEAARMQKFQPRWFPALMYHKIPDAALDTPHRIFVTKDRFARHLRFFASRGLTPVTFKDYEAVATGKRSGRQWPQKPILLTFDDGYQSVLRNAVPLMQARGWVGVMYVLADRQLTANTWDAEEASHPESRLMTTEEIRELIRKGWEIGAHTFTHPRLDTLSSDEQLMEIQGSKAVIEEQFEIPVRSFAYPFGTYTDAVVAEVRSAGYGYAVATDTGGFQIEDDRYRIFRVNIFPEESWFSLWKKTSPWYRRYYFRKRGQ